jgi:hypothetical protein
LTLHVMADVERMVIQYLLTVDEVTDLVGEEIGSRKDKPYPRLTVTRVGGSPGPIPAHLDAARIQVEAWAPKPSDGGGKSSANEIARVAQAAMYDMVNASHEDGVVTDVECASGPLWVPDPITALPRYILDFIVRVHPVASS